MVLISTTLLAEVVAKVSLVTPVVEDTTMVGVTINMLMLSVRSVTNLVVRPLSPNIGMMKIVFPFKL